MAPLHRYATDRGMALWHIVSDDSPPAPRDAALCGAMPAGGAWVAYTTVEATWQTVCDGCKRRREGSGERRF